MSAKSRFFYPHALEPVLSSFYSRKNELLIFYWIILKQKSYATVQISYNVLND